MHNAADHQSLWPGWIGEHTVCHIWIAGYGAAVSKWSDTAMHLADQGIALIAALQAEEGLHGGLVIKSGMPHAESPGEPLACPRSGRHRRDSVHRNHGFLVVQPNPFADEVGIEAVAQGDVGDRGAGPEHSEMTRALKDLL